jgi:hypothetical protein
MHGPNRIDNADLHPWFGAEEFGALTLLSSELRGCPYFQRCVTERRDQQTWLTVDTLTLRKLSSTEAATKNSLVFGLFLLDNRLGFFNFDGSIEW